MASSNCGTADDGQLKEVESKTKLDEQDNIPAVEGKVQADCAKETGKDSLGDDMSDVVDVGTTSVTETTNLHGQPLPDSQMCRNKGDNPDLHFGEDNCFDGTNAFVECFMAKHKDVCDTPHSVSVQNMSLILPELQVDGHQVTIKEDSVQKDEKQNQEKNENIFETCFEEVGEKLVGVTEEMRLSLARDEHLEQYRVFADESREEKDSGDARTYMVICWENDETEGSKLKSGNLSLLSDCSVIVTSNDHAANTGPLFMDKNIPSKTEDTNSSATTAAEQHDLETKGTTNNGDQRMEISEEGVNRKETRVFTGEKITAGKLGLTSSNDPKNNIKPCNSDDELNKYPTGDTICVRNEETYKANIPKNVKIKPLRSTLSLPSKKSSKIKMVKPSRSLPGRNYNQLLRKTREKSREEVDVLEEQDEGQRDSGSLGAGNDDRKSSRKKRWTRRRKQSGGHQHLCDHIADEENVEKQANFDDGSVDEAPDIPAERTVKQKQKGRKKNRQNRNEVGNSLEDPDEQDHGYSLRYVYYDTGGRNKDLVSRKQEQPVNDYGDQYHQRIEDDQISDHLYRSHRHQRRGKEHEKGCKDGNRDFKRSKTERSYSGTLVFQSSEESFAQEFRRSSLSSGSIHGERMDRSRDHGQHFVNLTITASGDGTRHVETAESVDGYSSFVNSVGSGARRKGNSRKKNKKKQPLQQDELTQVHDQKYHPCTLLNEEQAGGGFVEDIEYHGSSPRTVSVKSNPDELGRHFHRKSRYELKRNECERDESVVKGEYSKLLQHCIQDMDTDYWLSFSESTETSIFDGSQKQQPTKKHRKKPRQPQHWNVDNRIDRHTDEQITAEHYKQEMESQEDAGDRSSGGRANQKKYRQRERNGQGDGGRTRSGDGKQEGYICEVEQCHGGGDGHRRGGRSNIDPRVGQNLNNPNQSPRILNQRPGPRQNHTPQSQGQGQQYIKGLDYNCGQYQEFSPDSGVQRRGGSGRRSGHRESNSSPGHPNLSGGAFSYSLKEAYNYNGQWSGRARHGHQQGAHEGGQSNNDGQQSKEPHHRNKRHHRKPKEKYESYWSQEDVSAGLKRNTLIQGPIRVNPRNYNEAYVPLPDGTADVFISGLLNRNRALNGDIVAVQVLEREKWKVFIEDLEDKEAKVKPVSAGDEHDEDSGPDVVIEGVEVVSNEVRNQREDQREKQKRRTPSRRKTYTSVKEAISGGSPVAKSLFEQQTGDKRDMEGVNLHGLVQKTGKVVAVLETKHSRACSGHIRLMQDKNREVALFSPTDSRIPRIQISREDCPKDFFERPDDYAKTLFIARITEWDENSMFAKGHIARSLGEAGQIEPETEAILIEHNVDFDEFPEEVLKCLPQDLPWSIPASEFEYRRDLRRQCIFTIDPSTARDLDDAVSIEVLEDGRYEVGVHIADVSFFLEESTALDVKAAGRATSVYLVQKVIPMLPRLLCEGLCSLNPDEDRLCFSVIWKMDGSGEIEEEWFGRTIIRSCVKLSYDHAQGFIVEPDREWRAEELPPISGNVCVDDIKKRVLELDKIAKCLRKKRFDGGALRLDQVKLSFSLDSQTGMPNGYFVYEQKDSNRLIEEFMLLANMAVAHRIYDKYPEKALLRRHPPPQNKMVDDLKDLCEQLGMAVDLSNSQTWQQSLNNYKGTDDFSAARMQVLVALSSKPMQNAKYFCSGMIDDPEVYRHYALSVPLYTHFTSPIRRYADVIVHRLLAASLDYSELTSKDRHQLHKQAEHCNDKKYMSKRVQEMSSELFFAAYVREAGPFEEKAMVMGVMDHSFDVFILKFGIAKRVYCDQLDLKSKMYIRDHKKPQLTLVWKSNSTHDEITQIITIFTSVIIFMMEDKDPLRWKVLLKRPTSNP